MPPSQPTVWLIGFKALSGWRDVSGRQLAALQTGLIHHFNVGSVEGIGAQQHAVTRIGCEGAAVQGQAAAAALDVDSCESWCVFSFVCARLMFC